MLIETGQTSPLTADLLINTVYFESQGRILRCQPTFQGSYFDALDLAPLAPVELDHLICIPFSTHEVTHPSAAGQCHLHVHGPRVENIHVLANHFHISDIKSQECERWPKAVVVHWVHWIRPRPPYSQQQPLHHLRHGRHVAPSLSLEKLVASPRYWPMLCALFLTAPPLCCMCLLINLPGPTRN